MSHTLLLGIYLLILANALVCGGVIAFLFVYMKRQREGFQYLSSCIGRLEKHFSATKAEHKTPEISIPIDEPIAKYEQVNLPDDVKINFVED